MAVFRCKMCGGDLEITKNESVCECIYCGTKQTVPQINDEKIANLFNRANQLRMVNRFDEAKKIYEDILLENNSSAEAHWGVILCKYGIEYVDDTKNNRKIPTCHRTIASPIFADIDYIETINHADESNKAIYEQEAALINEIQQGIIKQAEYEEDYDVFICYKETDDVTGDRTEDSVIAQDLYYELEKRGFKTFFARKTLEGKLGSAYEPIIYSALSSSEVMVVLGTKSEYFTSVWLRNEWSRYLDFAQSGNKLLVPAYRGFSPYELPKEFSNLQALDMGKIGFMQDLIDSITKVVKFYGKSEDGSSEKNQNSEPSNANPMISVSSLLKRVDLFLADKNWSSANEYCEKVLDIEPENHMAYIKKVMARCRCTQEDQLYKFGDTLAQNSDFNKAVKFADEETKSIYLSYPQKYYQYRVEQEEKKLSDLYNESKQREENALNNVKAYQEMLKTQKGNYAENFERKAKIIKKAKIISFITLAVIYLFCLLLVIIPSGDESADAAMTSEVLSTTIFTLLYILAFFGIVINGILNCVGSLNKNKISGICRCGLKAISDYSTICQSDYNMIVKQKNVITANYNILAENGYAVPAEKLQTNIEKDFAYYNGLEKITDFDFAIAQIQKEDSGFEKARQRHLSNPQLKNVPLIPKKKVISLILCILFGYFGFHKFYEGKIVLGVLYLFTLGFFGLGIVYDFFNILQKPNEYY